MGEISAKEERILGDYIENQVALHEDICLLFKDNFTILHSFDDSKLKYFQSKAFGYNKCKFSSIHMADLVKLQEARKNEF